MSLETEQGLVIVDAGTGLARVETALGARGHEQIVLLFTHFHLDHLMGLPCLRFLCREGTTLTVMAAATDGYDWRRGLTTFLGKPHWPVGLDSSGADVAYRDIPAGAAGIDCLGVSVSTFAVPHPQGCLAYRFASPDASVVVATDTEYTQDSIDRAFVEFVHGADYVLMDAQYTSEEYPSHRGWGHSTWRTAAELARQASIGTLVLTHHSPTRSDEEIDAITASARALFPNTVAAASGLELGGP